MGQVQESGVDAVKIPTTLRVLVLRFFALRIVTPFTPFILSDCFFAPEIEKYGLRNLNPRSVDLSMSGSLPPLEDPIIFLQVNQIDAFCDEILGGITQPFILITGKWHLPGLQLGDSVRTILKNPHLKKWYSQNQIFDELPILPFPYGVKLSSAPHVWWRMRMQSALGLGRSGVFVPHVASHAHLEGFALEARIQLHDLMGPRIKLAPYLNKILRHKFVISPPGDRMDTYRHWECIALGAIPVSNLPPIFADLFGRQMLLTEALKDVAALASVNNEYPPLPARATVAYWRNLVHTTAR